MMSLVVVDLDSIVTPSASESVAMSVEARYAMVVAAAVALRAMMVVVTVIEAEDTARAMSSAAMTRRTEARAVRKAT